jgi:hypothetical protein
MTATCIQRPSKFKPNEFYKAYAKHGTASSGYLSEIIEKSDDDFCREWACELSVDIYFHNAPDGDSRKTKISEYKEKEELIYSFLRELLSSEEKLKNVVNERGTISDIIINQWGKENRFPMKMQALIANFDLMNENNMNVCMLNAQKIIETYNFNYNILGWINGEPTERPPLPEEPRLKKMVDAIFKDKYKDTYLWVPENEGGFTYDEIEIAVKTADRKTMKRMISVFKKIVASILKQKILIGLGNNELQLMAHFNQKTWQNEKFNWDNKFLEIVNNSGEGISLLLKSKNSESNEFFVIPGRSRFVWFVPPDEYTLSGSQSAIKGFSREISINEKNLTVEVVPN